MSDPLNQSLNHSARPSRSRAALAAAVAVIGIAVVGLLYYGAHRRSVTPVAPDARAQRAPASMSDMPGMAMSPPAGGGAAQSTVQLTASQIRQFGVTFGTAEVRPFETRVRTTGTVTADETKLTEVAPKFGGFVERLYVAATGQSVRRGQPLMDVYSPELVAAEAELLVAGRLERSMGASSVPGVAGASSDLVAAATRRLQLWDISDAQIAEVLRTGMVRRTLTLSAPASGIVLQKNVVQGQAIQAGQTLYTIASLADVWVDVALREQDAGAVRAGTRAIVELASFPGRPITGRVAFVYPTLDSAARTIRARVQVANPDGRLKPGMYATVTLATAARAALTVPASAVVNTGARALVFVDMGGGGAEGTAVMPRDVVLGRVAGDDAEVLSGLEPGQRVVTSAQFLIDAESNLGEVMRGMEQKGADVRGMKGMSSPSGTPMPPARQPTRPPR